MMTKQQRNEYVHLKANKNIEHFVFHFVGYIRMDFGNTDKFSCTLKTNTVTATKTWLTNHRW